MPTLNNLGIAVRAALRVPPYRLAWHLRRRVYGVAVPMVADWFLARLNRKAAALPPIAPSQSPAAQRAAGIVAKFFQAKHSKNVPKCMDGCFTFLNLTHDFGSVGAIDWRVEISDGGYPLWRANLAFMGYLCPAADYDPDRGLALAATLVRSFTEASKFQNKNDFKDIWNSYPVSQRILALSALMVRLPERLVGTPDWHDVDSFVRLNVAYLLENMEIELGFNHLERNLSALALYALACGQISTKISNALKRQFDHVVGHSIGADGVQQERSAMYQGLTVQSLRVLHELNIWTPGQRALLEKRLKSVEMALAGLTMGDDMPMLMNDSWFEETPATSAILDQVIRPGFMVFPDAGYVRLAEGEAIAIFDAGPIGPDANPGHGHPDFLAVELSLGTDRLIVDPGTSSYASDHRRRRDRTWDEHNGPAIVGLEPVEFVGSFKVGRRAAAKLERAEERDGKQYAAGTLAFDDVMVRRELALSPQQLVLTDTWPRGEGNKQSRFLVPQEWQVTREGDRSLSFSTDNHKVRWEVLDGELAVGESTWTCFYNRSLPAHEVAVRPGASGRVVIQLEWNDHPATAG